MSTFMTQSGQALDLLAPDPSLIRSEDITHALSLINRYNGHTYTSWSVAQHTVVMMEHLEARGAPMFVRQAALIHDFPEYVLGDITRHLKILLGDEYARITTLWEDAICVRYKLSSGDTFRSVYAQHVAPVDRLVARSEMNKLHEGAVMQDVDPGIEGRIAAMLYDTPPQVADRLRDLIRKYMTQ